MLSHFFSKQTVLFFKMCGKQTKQVPCIICSNVFRTKYDMLKHISDSHKIIDNIKKVNFTCHKCQVTVEGKSFLIRHIKEEHVKKKCQKVKRTRLKIERKHIKCVMCDYVCIKSKMLEHYNNGHGVDISTEYITFFTFDQFIKWKNYIEEQTASKFIRFRTKIIESKDYITYYYRCNRDGCFNISGKPVRTLKSPRSEKINGYCPAAIRIQKREGKFHVKYLKSHVGHEMGVRRLPISAEVKHFIVEKLTDNVPLDEILEEVNALCRDEVDRASVITKRDLYNIKSSFGITTERPKGEKECEAVDKWIRNIRQNREKSSIRFHKSKGQYLVDYPELNISDFMLIFMNDSQLELLKKCRYEIVCIDAILDHLTPRDVKITSLIVVDSENQCFPCACLFANRQDIDVLNIFFTVLKVCIGYSMKPKILLTDLSEIYYISWCIVMETPEIFYYNDWSLEIDWRKHLRIHIRPLKKQTSVSEKLGKLLREEDENIFEESLEKLLNELELDHIEFYRFFKTRYKNSAVAWARCFRSFSSELTLSLERLHESISYIYKEACRTKHLNHAVQLVVDFIKEKLFRKGNFMKQIGEVTQRHMASLEETANYEIKADSENSWTVDLVNKKAHFKVERSFLSCFCELRCIDCAVCIHTFRCTCPDFYFTWNMCTHIHMVCQFLIQTNIIADQLRGVDNVQINNLDDIFMYSDDLLSKPETELVFVPLNEVSGNIETEKELLRTQFQEILNSVTSLQECQRVKLSLDSMTECLNKQRLDV